MIAITGILVQSFVRFPGFPPFPVSDPARPLAVLKGLMAAETNSVLLALLVIGVVELTIGRQVRARLVLWASCVFVLLVAGATGSEGVGASRRIQRRFSRRLEIWCM